MSALRGEYSGTAARREAILESAFQVSAKSGFRGGSMPDIAHRMGIAHTTLLHHFPSKDALLLGVLQLRDAQTSAIAGPDALGGIATLHHVLDTVALNQRTEGLVELYCILSAEATDSRHPAHGFFQQRYRDVVAVLRVALEQLAADGLLRARVDPVEEAARVIALMDGLQVQWLLSDRKLDMVEHLRHHFDGILTEPLARQV